MSRQRLYESINREARILYNTLDIVKSDLQVLADEGAGISTDPIQAEQMRRNLSERFSALMQTRPSYIRIVMERNADAESGPLSVKQAEDRVRAKSGDAVADADLSAMLQEARSLWAGNVRFSRIIEREGPNPGAPKAKLLYAATPVTTKDGRIEGALVIAIDFDVLFRGFGRPSSDIEFFLGDRDGNYLYRPPLRDGDRPQSSNFIDEFNLRERWQKWTSGSDPQLRFDDPDKHLSVVLYRVLLSDPLLGPSANILVVGGAASLADVEAQIIDYRAQLIIMVLVVSGLAALALAGATAYLTRPIQALIWVADRIAAGDHDVSTPASSRRDEFGVLARAMIRMLDALRESAKIEEQAAMGRMATMIAHDVRNALSSVKMNLRILHGHHRRNRDEYVAGCEIALDQVAYMENVLTDMLDFARPDGMDLDWVDLDEMLKVATMSMLPAMVTQSVAVSTDPSHKLPKLLGDRTRLIQVFQNLLANAIQAMPHGGNLKIEAKSQLHQSRPAVEITITDTGCGIPEEIRGKIFEPFFTTRAKGTGLGLTIVQRLVQAHGGELRIEPNPEGGSIARVILPLVPADWQPACIQLGNLYVG